VFKKGQVCGLKGKIASRIELDGTGAPDVKAALREVPAVAGSDHQVVVYLVANRGFVRIDLKAVHAGIVHRIVIDVPGGRLEQELVRYVNTFVMYVGYYIVVHIVDTAAKYLYAAVIAFIHP